MAGLTVSLMRDFNVCLASKFSLHAFENPLRLQASVFFVSNLQKHSETLALCATIASVTDFTSVLRENDIKALCVEFNIPKEIAWRVPGKNDRAYVPPEGHITVYVAHLRSGLRLPLPEDLQSVLQALHVPIAQLHANAIRYLCTMCIFLRKRGKKLRMSTIRVLFKINQGGEWISLVSRPGLNIGKTIHDSLKNWKNRFFFMSVGTSWPPVKDWGQVPDAYTGTSSTAEVAAQKWAIELLKENPDEFERNFLVSREETGKVNWGPPSPIRKPTPPVRMMNPEDSMSIIIRMWHTDEGFIGPLPEIVLETPLSSSSLVDYVAVGICSGPGSTAGLEKTHEDWPTDSGVILALPAPQAVLGAESMESFEEPACESVAATRTFAVEPTVGLDSSATTPEATRGDPAAATLEAAREEPGAIAPETAREELAAAIGEDDELVERILDEAAASLARESAPGPPSPGPGLEARPERPTRRLCESRKLISAFSREVVQRDQTIADREAEIVRLDARLAASGGEHREQTAALEAVLAGIETEIASLRTENARLKEEEDRRRQPRSGLQFGYPPWRMS